MYWFAYIKVDGMQPKKKGNPFLTFFKSSLNDLLLNFVL